MRFLLRLESLLAFRLLVLFYRHLGGTWGTYIRCFLAPDLALLVFLASDRVGSVLYNITHSTLLPGMLIATAYFVLHRVDYASLALIWLSHVHFDRALGYGLKSFGSFRETHLGRIGKTPVSI